MAVKQYSNMPKEEFSTFATVQKLLKTCVDKCIDNMRLNKLMYYTDRHALGLPDLTTEQVLGLIKTSYLFVPKIDIKDDKSPTVMFSIGSITPTTNETVRDIELVVSVLCPYTTWQLDDFKLRPFVIAGELNGMFEKSPNLSGGIGEFLGAESLVLNNTLGGIVLHYNVETTLADYESHGFK